MQTFCQSTISSSRELDPSHHLGCTYKRDPDGTLVADPTNYIEKILETCECTFCSKPKKARPPLEESDHPELDTLELCNDEQIRQYQTLIGQLMWGVTLGRLDMDTSMMTMSRFNQAPRVGHLQWVQRSFGYLANLLHGAINRILSKVQKSFWSCTHVNSYSKFTLHINLHILVMILIKA